MEIKYWKKMSSMVENSNESTFEPKASRLITHEWVNRQLKGRQAEFSKPVPLTVFCGTWNVNNKNLTDKNLECWLFPDDEDLDVDLFAIG